MRKGFEIRFQSNEDHIQVRIDTPTANGAHMIMATQTDIFTAPLVAAHLRDELSAFIEEKVRIAYRRGYTDGRGHKRQAEEFYGDFDLDPVTGVVAG